MDVHEVDEGGGAFFYLRVVATQDRNFLDLYALDIDGHDCTDAGGVFEPAACTVGEVGEAAGCEAGQWCDASAGAHRASPGCVSIGGQTLGAPCDPSLPCEVGLTCDRECIRQCDPASSDGVCGGDTPTCRPEEDGDATLPWGTCAPTPCATPLGAGQCDGAFGCSPFGDDRSLTPACVRAGPGPAGAACGDGCEAGAVCTGSGTCRKLCDAGIGWTAAPACPGGETCTNVDGTGVGFCMKTCEPGAPGTCPDGSFCDRAEMQALDVDVCSRIPASWPDANGLPAGSPCAGSRCGPMSLCLGFDTNGDESPDEQRCAPVCRLLVVPFDGAHPDCPAGTPSCESFGLDELGICWE